MKFYIYTLGCKVNSYESSIIKEDLIKNGYIELKDINEKADIYIINTCSVTNTADNKSLKLIRQAIKKNNDAIIIVCGCVSQVNKDLVDIDGVNIILGNKNKSKISEYINTYLNKKEKIIDVYDISNTSFETMKLNNFDKTRAFIKIQDGCNNFCSYCIIPYTRGNVRSKCKEDILDEVNNLVNNGHKEIVLTGIHTGNYGAEFDNYDFADLLNDLVQIKKLSRIRISSIEITELNSRVLEIIKNNEILVDHLHIPLQSGSDEILKLMNRKYDTKYFIEKINEIRKIRPNISITTDVIVGFPNEKEENFKETIETINKIKFSKLHVFPYSKRNGTKAAEMDNQIDEVTKKQRVSCLLNLSKKLENDYIDEFINKEITFIPEVYKDGYLIGHTGNYLLIKVLGQKELLNKEIKVLLLKNEYPYIIGEFNTI